MKKILLTTLMGVSVLLTGCFGGNKYEPISVEGMGGQIYVDHTVKQEEQARSNKEPYMLFFHAAWCPNCRALQTEILDNLDSMPKNTKIFRLNYDEEEILKEKYGINNQTMVVYFDAAGNNKGKKLNPSLDEIKKFFLSQPMGETSNEMMEKDKMNEDMEEAEEVAEETTETATSESTENTEEEEEEEEEETQVGAKAQFVAYSPEAEMEAKEAGKNYVFFFHAPWCPSCKALEEVINNSLEELPENTVVFKVDYDTELDMRKEYGVTQQHTLIGFKNGEESARTIGGQFKEVLELLS